MTLKQLVDLLAPLVDTAGDTEIEVEAMDADSETYFHKIGAVQIEYAANGINGIRLMDVPV